MPIAFDNGSTPGQRPIHYEAAKAVRPLLRPLGRSQQCVHVCISVAKFTKVGYLRFSEFIAVSGSACLLLIFSYCMGLERSNVNWRQIQFWFMRIKVTSLYGCFILDHLAIEMTPRSISIAQCVYLPGRLTVTQAMKQYHAVVHMQNRTAKV